MSVFKKLSAFIMMMLVCQTMLWAQTTTTIQVVPAGIHCQGDTVILTAPECHSGQIIMEERFESLTSGNDSTTNGQGSQINSMYNFPTMEKAYKAGGKVKLGSGSAIGSITSRSLDLSGPFSVVIRAKKWVNSSKDSELKVTVDGIESHQRTVNTSDYADYVFVFQASTAASTITIATVDSTNKDKRVFIDSVVVEGVGGGECTYLWSPGGQTSQSIEVVLQNDTVITVQQSNGDATGTATFSWQNPVVVDVVPNPVPPVCEGTAVMLSAHADYEDSVVVFSEGFSAITLGNDNSSSGSSKKYGKDFPVLPSFPECDTGHVFVAGGALRFGDVSSGDGGYITSAPMNLSRPFIVKLWVRGWNNVNDNPCFFLMVDQDTVYRDTIGPMDWSVPYMERIYQSHMPATSTSTITIGNDTIHQRFFLDSVAVIILDTLQYVWDVPSTESSVTVTPNETTTYTVTATNGVGCSGTKSFEVTINHPVTIDTSATACDSFTWRGVTYTESGEYRDTLTDGNGCTQVDTLHLTISHSNAGDTTATACDNFDWYEHTNITASCDNLTHTFTNASGCDSVVTLHLTINRASNLSFTKDTCDSYKWRGKTYTESGEYRDTLTDGNGCTQVDTLHLTIHHSVAEHVEATACDSFEWHGQTFYESTDTATYRTTNALGCDSVVTLHLTINHGNTGDTTAMVCDSFDWYEHTNITASCDNLTHTFTNASGCDSVVTLHLTINRASNLSFTKDTCDSYTWRGKTYTENGEYRDTLTDGNGCTQVDTLHLTIHHSVAEHVEATACDSFEWHGRTFYESTDTATYRTTNALGCDSVVTLHLTINHSSTGDTTATACDHFDWYEHANITASCDNLTHTFTNASGCDSVVTLHLTISHSSTGDTTATACDRFDWYEHANITSSCDNLTHTFTNASGCDSVVTLHLTVNHDTTVVITKDTCDWYQWHNTIYRQSGRYEWHGETAQGCDSTEVLWLTIRKSTYGILNAEVCEDDLPLVLYGQTFTESVMSNAVISNAAGCDSLILINVTVKYNTYSDLYDTIVENSLPYDTLGMHFTETGTQTDTISNVAGCDSIVTFHLQVWPNAPITELDTVVCEGALPLVWHDSLFTVAGQKTVTLHTQHGADSVVTMHLTVNPMYDIQETAIVSQGDLPYLWHGSEFSADTTVCDTLRTEAGCDSVVCLDLAVTAYHVEDTIIALCQGETYPWHGQILSEARSYRDTVLSENTIYIATVTINPTYSVTSSVIVPQGDLPYVWHGRAFSADTTVCDTLRTQAGCDSVVCLDLAVTAYNVEDTTIALCPGETYPWHGQTLSEARSYRDTVPEENTIYIATVTISPTYSVTDPVIVMQSQLPYVWHGREFSADTTVCDTLRTQAGCDSVVCLDLAVTAYNVEDTTIALCPGETYPWHGQTLSEARSYRDTVPEENTIYIATVTLNPTYSVTDPVIVPQGQLPYLWHGREFSADTTVCDTLRTQAGCDSVVCIDLTVTAYNVEDTAIALCPGETYLWHGQTLSEARSYRDTVPEENTIYIATVTVNPTYAVETFLAICENQLPYHYVNGQIDTTFDVGTPPLSSQNFQLSTITGCDSIVTLHLTVSSPTVSDIIVSSCGSFVWHGRTFTESTDTATFRTTNAAGCDIILTLHLTVNPLDSTDLYESSCAGDTYDFNGRLISQEGIYRDTIHRQEACDSIVILHLSILNPSHQSYTIERCGSYTWENGDGQTYTESGQYYYRHENSDGCMQVDTLFLTIHPLPATPILSITPNTGCTENNGIITVTAPVGGYLYDFDGGGFQSSNTFANLNAGEYIVSVRDVSHGCVSTTTALVTTVGNTLAVEVSGTSPCEGEDMQLFAETQSGGVTYLWSGPDNFTSTLQNPIVGNASPANAGVYTVLVTEMATGCVASGSLTVAVNPLPVVTVSGDAMIMIGHSATLTAMGADSYLWSNGAATPVVTVSPQEMTTYTVTGTNTFGCNDTASFEVVVIYDCFLPAQNGEEYVHCVSQVVPPQLPEVIACGDTIPLVAGENMGNVESGCGDSVFVYHYTFRDTQYTWTYTYHVSPDAMPLLNNRSIIISCLSDTVKPTPPVMVNSCLDTIVPIEMPVEVEVTGCSGVVRYVWKYEDCAGHQQNWTFSYIIRDNIAPTFSQPGDVAICRNANGTYDADTTITGLPVSLNDNCADTDDLSVSYNDLFVDNQNMADTLFRTWVVTDPCGNVARAVQKIIVYDTYHTEIHEGICGRDLPYTFNVGGRDTIISAVSSYSSTFNFPLISQHGCDSLVTLHLTVDTVAEIQEQLSICENELPYHFTYGQIDTIFEEGTPAFATYRFLIPAQGGCESIVWLALTVTPSYNVDIYETACDMYIWHNTPYRQSGSYEWHGQTVNGCDSVETLRLTIHRSSMSVQDSTVCDNDLPFVWNGVTFYEAGNGSAVLAGANAEHCDSVVLMMLHVNRTDTTVLYDTIVENQLPYYYTNGQIDTTFAAGTAQSSTFRFLLQNVSGCDSTVTLYLTMNMNVTAQADSTVCENDLPLQWNGITFTGAGTDSVVLAASNGADSLLVMHVYVNPNTSAALYDTIVENQLPYHYTNGQIDTVFAVGTPHFTTSRFMLSNANGCDSAVTLKLTVILNVSVELDSAVCPSALPLIWNGVEFFDAGTDTAVVPASTGSDSVIVMHLTLLPVQLTNLHVEVCASDFPYHFVNGQIDTVIASLATHHAVFNFLFSTQDGCDSIVRLNLSVLDTSLSVVSLSDYCDNMSTTLSALSSMENFVWSTGEISQDIEVTAPGVYSVTASTGDCQSMSSYVVDACELVLYLPNAISPGKLDGHNDCFSLPERYIGLIDEFEITIVNRWGEVVFHSNDKNFKWYGDYKGSVVRQNVYNYIIHYTELDPKKGRHHLKGALIVL